MMSHVAGEGRTVLFVSHNMAAVQSLCDSAIWLREGRLVEAGLPSRVVATYLHSSSLTLTELRWDAPASAPGNDRVRLHRACVRCADGAPADPITTRSPLLIEFEYWALRPSSGLGVHFNLINQEGTLIFNAGAAAAGRPATATPAVGLFRDVCRVPGDLLNDGTHRLELWIAEGEEVIYRLENLLSFDVHESPEQPRTSAGKWVGAVRPALQWHTEVLAEGDVPPRGG